MRTSSARILEADREALIGYCRPAQPIDYHDWLVGCRRQGGKAPKRVAWDMPDHGWFVLVGRPHEVPALYGALSVTVIVPADVGLRVADLPRTLHGVVDCGHNTLLFHPAGRKDRFEFVGHLPPLYADVDALVTRDERRKLGL